MAHGLSCSAARGNLPGPGLEPVSPALAGGFLTTVPPGKPESSGLSKEELTGFDGHFLVGRDAFEEGVERKKKSK